MLALSGGSFSTYFLVSMSYLDLLSKGNVEQINFFFGESLFSYIYILYIKFWQYRALAYSGAHFATQYCLY